MITHEDNGKGLVKVYWKDIAKRVAKVEPEFAKLVNNLSPDKNYPLFLGYYPYGMYIGDTISLFVPGLSGGSYRLSDPKAPKEVIEHLGYGINSSPLGMVLDKELEFFLDLKCLGVTIPSQIYSPGSFFAISRILSKKKSRIYAPNGILSTTSGSRSVFMLPHIGCATNHSNLQRDFDVQSPTPKSLYEHWYLFKELLQSKIINCNWRSCIMFFSEKWIEKILNDKAWLSFRMHLHEFGWLFEYNRNRIFYDIAFSTIQQTRNLKPNPYLADTAKHLFATALGAAPGYIPATSNDSLPWDSIQSIFTQSYGLKKYHPTVMQPKHFNFETDKQGVYYSLQHPSIQAFAPKSRKVSSTLFEMRELRHIMRIFTDELSNPQGICADTIMGKVAREIEFKYFHNEHDQHKAMMPSNNVINYDKRFKVVAPGNKVPGAKFACDAKFLRGCISINSFR